MYPQVCSYVCVFVCVGMYIYTPRCNGILHCFNGTKETFALRMCCVGLVHLMSTPERLPHILTDAHTQTIMTMASSVCQWLRSVSIVLPHKNNGGCDVACPSARRTSFTLRCFPLSLSAAAAAAPRTISSCPQSHTPPLSFAHANSRSVWLSGTRTQSGLNYTNTDSQALTLDASKLFLNTLHFSSSP